MEYLQEIDDLVEAFGNQVSEKVDSVLANLSARIADSLTHSDGVIALTPENASAVISIAELFKSELLNAEFYAAIVGLFFSFSEHLAEFDRGYDLQGSGLTDAQITDEMSEIMASQTGIAVATIEDHAQHVLIQLRQLLAKSVGNSSLEQLIQGVSVIVRKINGVKLVAKDQLMILFRLLGFLIYSDFEDRGQSLEYTYTGPEPDSRDFCKNLMLMRPKSISEINNIPSNHFHGTFVNCGGYGCRHFWRGRLA
jgi:hypothetical protein